YQHLLGISKPLLPLHGKPLLQYWFDKFSKDLGISQEKLFESSWIICNDYNQQQFQVFCQTSGFPMDHVQSDGTRSNDERLGAVKCMMLAIQKFQLKKPVLIVAGDTLFLKDFNLRDFIHNAGKRTVVCDYLIKEDRETLKTGIIVLDQERRVTDFLEKPDPSETISRLACPCFYLLQQDSLLFEEFFKTKQGSPLEEMDATGKYIQYLIHQRPVYSYRISGRLDIGGLSSFIEAEAYLDESRQ
ncbi:nucleotide-diphospho-sugar transferase, partial [Gorgonomyces haynaldii]